MNLRQICFLTAFGWLTCCFGEKPKGPKEVTVDDMKNLSFHLGMNVDWAATLKLVSAETNGNIQSTSFLLQTLPQMGLQAQQAFSDGVSFGDFGMAIIHASNTVNSAFFAWFSGAVVSPYITPVGGAYVGDKLGADMKNEYDRGVDQILTFMKDPSWAGLVPGYYNKRPSGNRQPGIYQNQAGATQGIVDMSDKGDLVTGPDVTQAAPKEKLTGLDLIMLKVARRNLDEKLQQFPASATSMPGFDAAVATMKKLAEDQAPKMAQDLANRMANSDKAAIEFFMVCEAYAAGTTSYEKWVKAQDKYKASIPQPAPKGR